MFAIVKTGGKQYRVTPGESIEIESLTGDVGAEVEFNRVLAVVDAYTRECLSLEVDTSLSSRRVTGSLETVVEQRGMPESIRCDNGPELTSRHFLGWCEERKIQLIHIQPGRPMQNGQPRHSPRQPCQRPAAPASSYRPGRAV